MVDFSNNAAPRGFFQPERFEGTVYDCEVTGKIPTDINGAFVRLGGDWFYPPMYKDDASFDSDGYMSMFRFKNGSVDYRGRWVRTPRWHNNAAAHRQLYGNYRNPYSDDPSIREATLANPPSRTVANTTPFVFGGKLFALKEDAHPFEMNPQTLESVGSWDFNGQYKSQTFTAHPKLDPVSGDMLCFGYEATGLLSDDVFLYTFAKDGHLKHEARFKVPYVSMIHDIALSQKHVIFPVFGYVTSLERLKAGKVHWAWDAQSPTYFGIMPRDGDGKDIRWFKGPPRAVVHTLNARTVGDTVIVDAAFYDGNPFPFFPSLDGSPWDRVKGRAYFRRLTFKLNSKDDSYTEEILFPNQAVSDLQRIDDRYLTMPIRYGFTNYSDPIRPFDETRAGNLKGRVSNCYGRFELDTGKISSYFAGDTHSLQECSFVPRKKNGAEGDGYLIGVANNLAEMRSELIIADAQHLEDGDVARVILPFRSSAQVHGRWFGDDEADFG